jgi:streptogramin lyase
MEAEQLRAEEEARRANPEAVAKRELSQTQYEGLDAKQTAEVATEAFPEVVAEPAGGHPRLPTGESIVGYPTTNAAQVDLDGSRLGLIESTGPMAIETGPGKRTPVDLRLNGVGGGFEPKTPVVALHVPKRLSNGVKLPSSGVSVTPVDASGSALAGSEGELRGVSVLYASTQTDAATVLKATEMGFEAVTMLLGADSPTQLYFRVGLPEGASLVQPKDGSGAVDIVKEGVTIAIVLAPTAQDAAGTVVPVTMTVDGTTLNLSVDDRSAEYQFPIAVDPTFTEEQLTTSGTRRTNWQFHSGKGSVFQGRTSPNVLETYVEGATYNKEEIGYWAYQTQGNSDIYEVTTKTWAHNPGAHIESILELQYNEAEKGVTESKTVPPLSDEAEKTTEYEGKATTLCANPSEKEKCLALTGHEHNAVHFQQSAAANCTACSFSDSIREQALVYLAEPTGTHSTASFNKTSETIGVEVENEKGEKVTEFRRNALFNSTTWLSGFNGALQYIAKDPGIGVSATKLEYEYGAGKWEQVFEHNYLEVEGGCTGVQCSPEHTEVSTLPAKLPDGEDKIRYKARDAMPATESLTSEGTATVKVDTSKPHRISLGGLPFGNELSEKAYKVTASATDGEGSTLPSSGIASLKLFVENSKGEKKELVKTAGTGECSIAKGECTATAEYTLNGAELGAGHHGIVITANDRAGNEGREEEQLSVRHSTPVTLGPGSVDLQSGDVALSANDVTMGAGLTVGRNYSSRNLTEGELGPLGPQWNISLGTSESLVELVDGSVLVTSSNGGQTIFAAVHNAEGKATGKFEAPPGDSNLSVRLEENGAKEKVAYYLEDAIAHTKSKFTLPSGGGKEWVPTLEEGTEATDTVTYAYQTVEVGGKKITRPTEELAPHPAVTCSPKLQPGCRALKFTYAEHTKPGIGESPSEWGEYEGRLLKVSYEGYNPATKGMTETPVPVAQYAYDKLGRLRAEWDPRISSALQTDYGYDAEGHVTAETPPGQESWAFIYGTAANDAGSGRLVKLLRAPASAGVWTGEEVKKTAAPTITGKPIVNVRLAVSTGTWSGHPVAYSYQWEDCTSTTCKPILGATNPNYTATASDYGYKLTAVVSATNGGGTVATTVSTTPVLFYEQAGYTPPGEHELTSSTEGPDGNLWFTNKVNVVLEAKGKVGMVTPSGTITEYATKSYYPTGITSGPDGNLWFLEYGRTVGKLTTTGTLTRYKLAGPVLQFAYTSITAGPSAEKALWITDDERQTETGEFTNPSIIKVTSGGVKSAQYKFTNSIRLPEHITVGPDNNLWFINRVAGETAEKSEAAASSIVKMTTAGVMTEYPLPKGSDPTDITSGPGGYLWFTEAGTNKVGKITTSGTITEYALPANSRPSALAAGPTASLWVTEAGTAKMARVSSTGAVTYEGWNFGGSLELAEGSDHNMWQLGNQAVTKTTVNPTEGALVSPGPGTTLEYNVPVTGTGAPHNLSQGEVAKWGQKAAEAPEESTALIPSDSPQGWPASSYTRATIYYLDGLGRVVNTASPSTGTYGAISTTEYNEFNDIVRTLSPSNRATALENSCESTENCKSAEVSHLLDTVNIYNEPNQFYEAAGCRKETAEPEKETAEPGTRLCETWGPEHVVKYVPNGFKGQAERLARKHIKYYYEDVKHYEEAGLGTPPAGEKYDLVTETQVLAQLYNAEGKSEGEEESRRSKTSYSGQGKLGWELRAPTSTVAASEAEGAKLERKTIYYEAGEAKGQVKETRGPKGLSGGTAHDSRVVYYTAEENKEGFSGCGKHAEWAGLVCETLPAAQPAETANIPNLPATGTSYNIWDEPEKVEEVFAKTTTEPAATRTRTETYNEAGILTTSETSSTSTKDTSLPKVTDEYNSSTGLLEKQSATVSGKTKTITSKYNTLGQLESYTDADGNIAKYKYASPESGGLLEEMSDSSGEGSGGVNRSTQKYTYNETTKQMTKLEDSAAGVFTASYNIEGALTSEVYPNNMCAAYTYNSVGEATHVEYIKTANCSEKEPPVWYGETKIPSVRGETMSRSSTLANETYTYDTLGRLTETQETPTGEFCKTRNYAYDEESNRTSLTTREPNSKKECASEGGTVQAHSYDEANRLTDTGIEYDPLDNVTKLPAVDGEGHELKSTFYVDNAVATQEQNGVKNEYFLDPNGRVHETASGTKRSITHYDASGESVAWTCELAGSGEECVSGVFTREIPGIDGTLAAVQTNGATPVLQLHDLEGDVVATAADNLTETKLLSTYNSTEFGAPNGGKAPPTFAWLGASNVQSSLSTGVITYGATSYVPQTGRALQNEAVEPPGVPGGSGVGTPYTAQEEPWNQQGAERVGSEAPGKEAAREREAALKAAMANLVDPEGLLSGQEALTLAHQLKKQKENLTYYHDQEGYCGEALNPTACDLYFESGETEDGNLASALEGCYYQVHNAGWVHQHYYTKTCLVDFSYTELRTNRVVEPGWSVNICFSYHVGQHSITYSSSSWWCGSDQKWWTFSNRGWWESYK